MKKLNCFQHRNIHIAILMVGLIWIWFSRAEMADLQPGKLSVPYEGFQSLDFELNTISGEPVRLSDLKGKPIIINFWASWCAPCRLEMPALQRIYEGFQNEDLVVLGINATNMDNPESVAASIIESGVKFPVLMDINGTVTQRYQVRAFPTTIFVDAQGVIQHIEIGGPLSETLMKIHVQQLLNAEKPH